LAIRLYQSHPVWVIANHFTSKSLMAAKFFIAASFLGPEKMGIAGLLLVIYAISESLTEFGLIHAVIQAKDEPKLKDLNSIWWSLALRGLCLAIILFGFGYFYPIESKFESIFVFSALFISCSALVKSLYSPNYYLAQRNRTFSRLFLYNGFAAIIDITVCLYCLYNNVDLLSIFISLLVSESVKLITSYFFFGFDKNIISRVTKPTFKIEKYINFGKWIWVGNCNNIILNQSDKLLSGILLGTQQLGFYQMSSRIAQLGISDVAMAIGQYLFPTLSRLNTGPKKEMEKTFSNYFCYMLIFSFISSSVLISSSGLLPNILGDDWGSSVVLLQILAITMSAGSLISVLVAFVRAEGNPKLVTISSFLQLLVFVPSVCILGYYYGVVGIAVSTILSTMTCLVSLLYFCKVPVYKILSPLNRFIYPFIIYILVFSSSHISENLYITLLIQVINAVVFIILALYIEKKNNENTN